MSHGQHELSIEVPPFAATTRGWTAMNMPGRIPRAAGSMSQYVAYSSLDVHAHIISAFAFNPFAGECEGCQAVEFEPNK